MMYANINNGREKPKQTGQCAVCPGCGGEVISKCGEFKIWHWAHKYLVDCNWLRESETEWHRNWKLLIEKNGGSVEDTSFSKYPVDGLIGNIVFEFQHSQISVQEIRERINRAINNGKQIVWVFDFNKKINSGNVSIFKNKFGYPYIKILYPPKYIKHFLNCFELGVIMVLDFGDKHFFVKKRFGYKYLYLSGRFIEKNHLINNASCLIKEKMI